MRSSIFLLTLLTATFASPIARFSSSSDLILSRGQPRDVSLSTRQSDTVTLDQGLKSKGKQYFGAAIDHDLLSANTQNGDIIGADFGQVTPAWSMKMAFTQPQQGVFDFSTSDAFVDWAEASGKMIRGHCLVWHQSLPGWLANDTDKDTMTNILQTHISTVVGRYRGQLAHWDVVNEPFNDDGTLRETIWYNTLGEDYIKIAFDAAKAADPSAKLYLNEYSLENASWEKMGGVVPYMEKWIAQGIPIDGIGSQSHLNAGSGPDMAAALAKLASITGLKEVALTELDIAGASTDDYVAVVNACVEQPKCVGITVWGVRDPDSWRPAVTPLLFDAAFSKKDAYHAILSQSL